MRRRNRGRRDEDVLALLVASHRRQRTQRRGPRRRVLVAIVLAVVVVVVAAAAASAVVARRALLDCTLDGRHARVLPRTSVVYAADGTYLGAIHAEQYRRVVPYDEISPWLRRATVAIEDRSFWRNDGIDVHAILRAALADVRAGRVVQGASTITQQLARDLYLNDDRTFARKREEACLAVKLTHGWSKKRILAAYLNRVPYGHRTLGVQAAAQTYFSISASRLGPAQAALIAGLPQAPSRYDPFRHPEQALARRNAVLRAMHEQGLLSGRQLRRNLARPLGLRPGGKVYSLRRNPTFFSYVRRQLVHAYGEKRVREGGLRVHTTLLPREQRLARTAIRRVLDRRTDPAGALVSIQPSTGAIRAMVAQKHGKRLAFNLAAQGRRQAGSAFKTFVLAGLVLEHANPYATKYDSAPFELVPGPGQKPWRPHTYENEFFGVEDLVTATLRSDNVVYAKLTLDLGPRTVARVAHRMGIESHLAPVPSIGLGSSSVSPLEMASAYATLAAAGVHRKPFAISRVVLPNGEVDRAHDWGAARPTQALPAGAAYWVTRVLQRNVEAGTGTAARIGRPAAGKTGTTSDWTDAWFVGYTRRRATAVWVGYPHRTRPMTNVHGIHVTGGSFPAQIWARFQSRALAHRRPLPWLDPPDGWSWRPWHGARRYVAPPPKKAKPLHSAAGHGRGTYEAHRHDP